MCAPVTNWWTQSDSTFYVGIFPFIGYLIPDILVSKCCPIVGYSMHKVWKIHHSYILPVQTTPCPWCLNWQHSKDQDFGKIPCVSSFYHPPILVSGHQQSTSWGNFCITMQLDATRTTKAFHHSQHNFATQFSQISTTLTIFTCWSLSVSLEVPVWKLEVNVHKEIWF